MKKSILGLLVNYIGLASCTSVYWSAYDPLINFHGTRKEYSPFEKRLYGISGTADRDCGGEMNMCYEVLGKGKKICAIDALGEVMDFPNMCEMLYSNCIVDKEKWRYTDEKKCQLLLRRFIQYDYENPAMMQTTTVSPYRAEMVKNMPQFMVNQPNNSPYRGTQFYQNAGNNGYPVNPGNPSYLSNSLPNTALPGMQVSRQQNQGTASQYPAIRPGYPYGPPMLPTYQGQNMLPRSPNMPKDSVKPMPLGFVPSKNNPNAAPPAFVPQMPRSLNPNGPPNYVPLMPPGYVPRQQPRFLPPTMPAGFNPLVNPGYEQPKPGYDPKISLGVSQPMSSGRFPQQPAGYGHLTRRDQTQKNINQSLHSVNTSNSSLQQGYGFPQLEMLLRIMSYYKNMTARDTIRKLIELSLWNSNETMSNELQDQITYELEKAYNKSEYKDVHKYLPLFNVPRRESQPTARRDNEMKKLYKDNTGPFAANEAGPNKYPYKMNVNEKEVYDQGVDNDDSNDTIIPDIQVPTNEYGDVDEFVDDLDIGF